MAEISDQDMVHLKTLARLELDADETRSLKDDLNKILASFKKLQELDTDGVEELARPVARTNVFRDDTPRPGLTQAEALGLAAAREEGFFRVPRTID